MSVLMIIENVKKIHPKEVVFVKLGEFYHVYGNDAYILSCLMGYKLNILEEKNNKMYTCGFPLKSLAKIEATLENKKISYIMLDRRNNYEVDEFVNFKNLNNYEKEFKKAYQYVTLKLKLDKIYKFLLDNLEENNTKNILLEIEKKLKI